MRVANKKNAVSNMGLRPEPSVVLDDELENSLEVGKESTGVKYRQAIAEEQLGTY